MSAKMVEVAWWRKHKKRFRNFKNCASQKVKDPYEPIRPEALYFTKIGVSVTNAGILALPCALLNIFQCLLELLISIFVSHKSQSFLKYRGSDRVAWAFVVSRFGRNRHFLTTNAHTI